MPASSPSFDRRHLFGAAFAGLSGSLLFGEVENAAAEGPVVQSTPDPFFSRMFQLPAFADPTSQAVREALLDIGRPGGPLDAADPLEEGPIRLITNPELSPGNRDNDPAVHTAGTTFMGQFLDHDITFDLTSQLGVVAEPALTPNEREATLNLDSVYGGGPSASPHLYEPDDPSKFLIGHGGRFEDLPRDAQGRALIGDFRNDENLMVAGLHAAFLLAHNRTVDLLRPLGLITDVWAQARRMIVQHWQWIVAKEFLPQIVTQDILADVTVNGPRWYRTTRPTIPVEFQSAAYRFGHSIVRPSYRANLAGDDGQPFFGFVFDRAADGQADPEDLRGGARAPRRFIGWQTFFDFGGDQTQHVRPNKRIDTSLSTPLFNLPLHTLPAELDVTVLAQRNLLRHLTWSLPSGQRIAAEIGEPGLSSEFFPELAGYGLGLESSTPLWYYVLREAAVFNDGVRLGPVGGRIVAETVIGLLRLDPDSFLNAGFVPTLPGLDPGLFTMTDLLRWARVDPDSRGE